MGFHLRGSLEFSGESLADSVLRGITDCLDRLRPQVLASVESHGVLYVFEGHPGQYRIFLVALTVLCAGLLWVLMRRLGASLPVAVIALAFVAASVQFRAYHDPLLGYHGTTQTALALVLGSLLALLSALRTGRWQHHAMAVALFVAACTLHEYVYPVAAAHLALALSERRGRAALRAAAPVLLAGAFFCAIGLLGRTFDLAAQAPPPGYEVSGSIGGTVKSLFVQLLPPLPASTRLFEQGPFVFYPTGSSPTPAEWLAALWRGLAVCVAVGGMALYLARRGAASLPPVALLTRFAALGAALWTTPVLLVAVAPKYQGELTPGKGYLPVLFQSFGFALAGTAALLGLLRLAAGRSRAALRVTAAAGAVLLGFAAGVTGFNNVRVAATDNLFRESRDLLETGAARGAFAAVPEGTTLLFTGRDTVWPIGDWRGGNAPLEAVLLRRTGKRFDGRVNIEETRISCAAGTSEPIPLDCEPFGKRMAWVRFPARPGGGSVLVAPLRAVGTPEAARASSLTAVRAYNSGPAPPRLIGMTAGGAAWSSDALQWRLVSEGEGWSIHEADFGAGGPTAESLTDADAKVDMLHLPGPDERVRIYGVKRLLP